MASRLLFLVALFAPQLSHAITVIVEGGAALCGNPTGYAIAYVYGGTPPYAYQWSNGAATDTITGLAPGIYSVVVTDAVLDEASAQFTVLDDPNPVLNYYGSSLGLNSCHGQCNQGIWIGNEIITPAIQAPVSFWPPFDQPGQGGVYGGYSGYCPGQPIEFTLTDAMGCGIQYSAWPPISGSTDPSPMSIVSVSGSCSGMNSGSVTVNVGLELDNAFTPAWQSRILDSVMEPLAGGGLSGYPLDGSNVDTKTNLAPGDYYVERRFLHVEGDCVDLLPFTIPDLGPDCGVITGLAFVDINTNCQNNVEPRVPQGLVEVQPGPYYASLDPYGSYTISLPTGSYTVTQQSASVVEHCTGGPIPFDVTVGVVTNVPLPDTSVVDLDLETVIGSGPARPGFPFQCGVTVRNLTPTASGNTTLTLTFDPVLGYVNASPTPSSVVGNSLTWNEAQLTAWQQRSCTINFLVPPDPLLLGTELLTTAVVSSAAADGALANNTATNVRAITGSYDPNDKLARTSLGSATTWLIGEDEWVDYTIRFQNTGTDTAFNVLITDTLPANLDPGTIIVGAASHNFTWELRDAGTLKFYFPNILLPDSNINEPLSHGFVSFRIRPRLPLLPGEEIENIANIYFDFNPPVITEPSVLVTTTSTHVPIMRDGAEITLFPNPGADRLHILLDSPLVGPSSVRVLGADGRAVWEGTMAGSRGVIDIAGLAPGGYILLVAPASKSVLRSRFIKQ